MKYSHVTAADADCFSALKSSRKKSPDSVFDKWRDLPILWPSNLEALKTLLTYDYRVSQHAYVLSTLHRPLVVGGRRVSRCVSDGLSHPRPAADMGGAARRFPRIHLDIDVDSGRRTDAPSGERLEVPDVLQSGITDHD